MTAISPPLPADTEANAHRPSARVLSDRTRHSASHCREASP
jgi:hypothetical protein